MSEENGISKPKTAFDLFSGKDNFRPIGLFAQAGLIYGVVVLTVLSTSPVGRIVAMYTGAGFGVLGILVGVRYGFLFNILNRCKGGRIFWAFVGGVGGVVLGVLAGAMIAAIFGTVVGLVIGCAVGTFRTGENQLLSPLLGAMVGAVAQAGGSEPTAALKAAAIGGACGVMIGPLFLLTCVALSYLVLRRTVTRRRF